MTARNSAAPLPKMRTEDVQEHAHSLIQSSVTWVQSNWLQVLIAIAFGTVIVVGLTAARGLGARLARRSQSGKGWPAVFGRAIQRTNSFFIITLAAKLVAGYADAPANVATTINFLFTLAAVFQAAIWSREIILGAVEHRTRRENYSGEALVSAMGLIRVLVTFALFSIALIVVLDNLGVNVTGLVAGLGVGGIAIGLAAQGIFADLFAALAIIFDRPFRRGDAITYAGSSGTVEAIGLKSTRVRGVAGEERIISNKKLLDQEILNNTKREYRRIQFTLGLVQWTPVEVMAQLPGMMKDVIEAHDKQFVRAGFTNFGSSSYDFDVEFDSPGASFQDAFDTRHTVGLAIIQRLADEKIDLAYPTQTDFTAAPDGGLIYPYPRRAPAGSGAISPPRARVGASATRGDVEGTGSSAVDQD